MYWCIAQFSMPVCSRFKMAISLEFCVTMPQMLPDQACCDGVTAQTWLSHNISTDRHMKADEWADCWHSSVKCVDLLSIRHSNLCNTVTAICCWHNNKTNNLITTCGRVFWSRRRQLHHKLLSHLANVQLMTGLRWWRLQQNLTHRRYYYTLLTVYHSLILNHSQAIEVAQSSTRRLDIKTH